MCFSKLNTLTEFFYANCLSEIDVNLATASSGISAGRMSSAYEQVDVELTQSGINYSALIRSEVTHPETNYETINQSSS